MANKINYKHGYRREIMMWIMKYGALPYGILRLYDKPITIQMQRCIKRMEKEELVERIKTLSGVLCIVFKKEGYDREKEKFKTVMPASLIEQFESEETNKKIRDLQIIGSPENRIQYITRQTKIINDIEAQFLVEASGISPGDIFDTGSEGNNKALASSPSCYYTSTALKRANGFSPQADRAEDNTTTGDQSRISNTRINGLITSPGGIYSVYAIGNKLPEWRKTAETKMAYYVQRLMVDAYIDHNMKTHKRECLVLAKTDRLFVEICMLDYSGYNKGSCNNFKKKSPLLNIDFAYESMYAVPYDKDGIIMLQLMTIPGWKEILREKLLQYEDIQNAQYASVKCDGYDEDTKTNYLVFCIPDLVKLQQFTRRARIENDRDKYRIYCFKHQISVVAPLVDQTARVYQLDVSTAYKEITGREPVICQKDNNKDLASLDT